MNLSDLIWIKPTVPSTPVFDWCDWIYSPYENYVQQLLDCITQAAQYANQLFQTDYTIVNNWLDIIIWDINGISNPPIINLSLSWSTVNIWNSSIDISWLYNTFMFNVFDWSNGFPISMGSDVLITAKDWLTTSVSVTWKWYIWLPIPDPQYFVPWLCGAHAHCDWKHYIIVADNLWTIWNITLWGDWVSSLVELIAAWNVANPLNTISAACKPIWMTWCMNFIPNIWDGFPFVWWIDPIPCDPGTYQPFNKWLVLTWDDCHHVAFWAPPQCCIQTLTFNGNNHWIWLSWWGHYDNWYVCTCGWCVPAWCWCQSWWSSMNINITTPSLKSINTDNQTLILKLNAPTYETLCLNRRHWWPGWVQISDPDSCVDLMNINEETLDLQGNLLYLLWSDWLINDVVDLSQVNEETLGLVVDAIDPTHYHDPAFPRHSLLDIYWCDGISNSQIDLMWVAKEVLYLDGRDLCVQKMDQPMPNCTPCRQQCIGLEPFINMTCDNVMNCVCGARIDRVDLWVSPDPLPDACAYTPPLPPGVVPCSDWGVRPSRTAQVYLKNKRVIYWWKRWAATADTTAWDVPWTSPLRWVISNSLWPNDAYETFFSIPRSIGEIEMFIASRVWWLISAPCGWCCGGWGNTTNISNINIEWDINTSITNITSIISKQKYRARIYMEDPLATWTVSNCRMWSRQANIPYWSDNNARWIIPWFDKWEWRHSNTTLMIDPTLEIQADNARLIIPGTINTTLWTGYNVSPSTNNYDSGNATPGIQAESRFARFWCKTIRIPKNGYYQVSLQWVLEVDHNVNAFRYCCLRYNSITNAIDILIDSKFWGWSSVGSWSLNNELVPCTHQYHWWGTKIFWLRAWDILFPAVKIDPRVIWPNQVSIAPTRDILDELDALSPKYWTFSHTPGLASGIGVSRSSGSASVVWNYSLINWWPNVATNEIPWPASNLPNVSPHYFSAHGGIDGAANYWRNLTYPGGNWDSAFWVYRRDDGVVTLYGPSSFLNSDGEMLTGSNLEWWASLSVHRVNSFQQ